METSEKWANEVRVTAATPERETALRQEYSGPLQEPYGVLDTEKTQMEIDAVGETARAVNDFLQLFCGLPPLGFSPDRVHIIPREQFAAKVSKFGQGKTMLGHIYLWQGLPVTDLISCLTHEMVHAAAYLSLVVREVDGRRQITCRRMGMLLADPTYGLNLPHFHGLNEAVTETAAVGVRHVLAARLPHLLGPDQQHSLCATVHYECAVTLIDRIVAKLAGNGSETNEIWKTLFLDHIKGTDAFLALLDARLPGATDVLRCTGARPDEVAPALEKLGFPSEAAMTRSLMG